MLSSLKGESWSEGEVVCIRFSWSQYQHLMGAKEVAKPQCSPTLQDISFVAMLPDPGAAAEPYPTHGQTHAFYQLTAP